MKCFPDVDDEEEDEYEEEVAEEGFEEHTEIADASSQDVYRAYRSKLPMNKEFDYLYLLKSKKILFVL